MPKQLLLAHRGYMAIAPENTDLAFETANIFGFDGVELDVHLTSDSHLVIIHDETTERTALANKTIAKSTLSNLKKDDHSKFFKITVPEQKILTLKEFLDKYLKVFKYINVEVKTDIYHYPKIEEKILELSKNYSSDFFDKIIFSSFNFETLKIMKKLNPKFKLAFLFWKKTEFYKLNAEEIKKVCDYLNPWVDIYDSMKYKLDKLQKPYLLWTIKSEKIYKKYLKDKKVFGQISNYKWK
ncbi:glycerophosphodiester phosphodiesterase family protein [Mesomycoplasma neurolyticum]|uniref:Glycerophosphodiester phosphodiesterase family protein n=1 Tax=Mesomycoplasma neurolyticum TaxID=2120 RepID=A0A449A5M4_9BACT|nr:glycerophosphodiester phosphodiesterase family protein [Mesomycoplasma neurolyticum]VEU59538.1 glycerophosphodiester phosphodiesterase family protein [Mesomycoplasma neurolyticum]